jgi:hypothetical protein
MKKITNYFSIAFSFLLYKWLVVVIELIRRICNERGKKKKEKQDIPRRIRKASKNNCVPIRHPNYHKPDPMIYAQYYLMNQGLAVTWDNPDIQLYLKGVPVSSNAVLPDTVYEIVARCWNASYDAPVVGMPVMFSYLDFGAGTANNPIGQATINLGVIGGSDNPNFAKIFWKTPQTPGHYCVQVLLEWSDDKNPYNNLGQENIDIINVHSPAQFDFKVRNSDPLKHQFRIEADSYSIPPSLPCREAKNLGTRKKEFILERNSRKNFPVPSDWKIEYNEEEFVLNADEEKTIKVTATPPDGFKGRKPLNFNVFDERNVLTGGVTVTIEKK